MRNIKRFILGLAVGGCTLAAGCNGTFSPDGATRNAMYSGMLGAVSSEAKNTLTDLLPFSEAAAILWNQPLQNWLCGFTGCNGAGLGKNNTGF